ncbi:hypothetical protein BGZ50_000340 [Haplosporangium sp. Z 11]|nr:hypothetical protein BGZ50_000340 [Haplosporangium sp. Z 11]
MPVLSYSTSSASSASSFSAASSPNTSPSNSPTDTCSSNPHITSPKQCDLTPYPASGVSPSELAALIEQGRKASISQSKGDGAGLRRPLVLDLRPNPDFEPLSIKDSININLPTLLMRRYRRGGAVSSFALESFITMPSDKDLYHLIQDGWRHNQNESAIHDVVVLDQDMKAGQEEYGRSAGPAWTLVSVLERGGGNLGGPIRLWYLEGGFEAFQAWDLSEKYMVRPGHEFEMNIAQDGQGQQTQDQDVEMTLAGPSENGKVHPLSMPLSLPSSSTVSSTSTMAITDAKTAQAIDNAVSLTNASLGGTPRQRGAPVRRESLFSLNTKSLQRPAGLSRAQTIGVSALNVKPLSIPSMNMSLRPLQEGPGANGNGIGPLQPLPPLPNKSSWLTVPNAGGSVGPLSLSPSMSSCNSTMDMGANSVSTDHASGWSANSSGLNVTSQGQGLGEMSNGFSQQQGASMLSSKKSFSSTTSLSSLHLTNSPLGIREEDEEGGERLHRDLTNNSGLRRHQSGDANSNRSVPPLGSGPGFGPSYFDISHNGTHQEHQAQMFSEGIDSYTNNSSKMSSLMSQHLQQQQQYHQRYDDAFMEEGGDNGEQEISCILPNFLYLGPEIATEEQVQELERLGIKRVLNMARECEDVLVSDRQGIEYHKVGVLDNVEEDVSTGLLQAVDIISASMDAPIYVHCKAGKSRSVTATIAYLITQLHWSLNKAYNHVLTQRPCMCPNIGFVTELMRMEEQTLGTERAGGLVRAGSLNSILSLSTAGSGIREHHHHNHHHSLQHTSSLSMGGSPKVLSAKSSVNNFSIMPQLQH